jgi:hypothetical protein
LTAFAVLWQAPDVARKLKIGNVALPGKATRVLPAPRRQPLTIAQTLRIGSRPNLAQLPSRMRR